MAKRSNLRVLIVRTSALGDVVQAIDAFRSLAATKETIHWGWAIAEPFLPLIEGVEGIAEVLVIPRKWSWAKWWAFKRKYRDQHWDLIIDLQGLLKSYLVTLALKHGAMVTWGPQQSRDRLVPYLATRVYEEGFISSRERSKRLIEYALGENRIKEVCKPLKSKFSKEIKHIVCSPGSVWPTKRLTHQAWKTFLQALRQDLPEARISMIAGSDKEKDWVEQGLALWQDEQLCLAEDRNLAQLKCFFETAQLYIGMDSGPSHLASSMGVPTLIFYGPSLPEAYDRFGAGPHAPRGVCHLNMTFEQRCSKLRVCETCSAITSIDLAYVWDNFFKDLKARSVN